MSEGFDEIVAQFNAEIRDLAIAARALIRDVMPDVVEAPWPKQRIVGYGVGPKKMSEHFCYLAPQKQHVNLGFNYGSELPDPAGLLEGTGELFRHVKLKQVEDLANPALRKLLVVASKHRMPVRKKA